MSPRDDADDWLDPRLPPVEGENLDPISEHVCRVCNRVLDGRRVIERGPGGERLTSLTFQHTAADRDADHEPVPVPVMETDAANVSLRCDFCLIDNPTRRLPVAPFAALPREVSNPDWICCDECATAIDRGDWNKVKRRGLDAWYARHPEVKRPDGDAEAGIKHLYALVRKHQTGATKPLA